MRGRPRKMREDIGTSQREHIQALGLKAIEDFFQVDIDRIDAKLIRVLHEKAKLGMQFEREMNLGKRTEERNYIKVLALVSDSKEEMLKHFKKRLPKYLE